MSYQRSQYVKDIVSGTIHAVDFATTDNNEVIALGRQLNFEYPHRWGEVLGSLVVDDLDETKFVLNPTTLQANKLQPSPFRNTPPLASDTLYVFGFDVSTDDYKLVCVPCWFPHEEPVSTSMFVDVYMLRRDSWRRIEICPCDCLFVGVFDFGSFVNGSLHWLAQKRSDGSYVIVAFDLSSEKMLEMALPSGFDSCESEQALLLVLEGCLCLLQIEQNVQDIIDVWMMEEYGVEESWTNFLFFQNLKTSFVSVCVFEGKKALVGSVKGSRGDRLVLYDLEDQSARVTVGHGIPITFEAGLTFVVESLVSPYSNSEIEGQTQIQVLDPSSVIWDS